MEEKVKYYLKRKLNKGSDKLCPLREKLYIAKLKENALKIQSKFL